MDAPGSEEQMLDCLRLLHFHVGSQVSDIATIKEAMRESSQMYAELAAGPACSHIAQSRASTRLFFFNRSTNQ